MNGTIWGHGWHTMRIDPWWANPNGENARPRDYLWEPVPVTGRDHATWLLGDARDKVQALRNMLADGSVSHSRLSDHHIIDLVAQKLADRRLLLFRKVMTPAPAVPNGSSMGAPQTRPSPQRVTATSKKAPNAPHPTPQPAQQFAPQLIEPEFASPEQDAQAATLRTAAIAGVPFCAVCEALKRQRAAETSPREAA